MWGVHQGSRSKRLVWIVTVAAVRWCRRDGDGDETRINGRENDQANIGVIRYDFGKTDLHPHIYWLVNNI
jgi:hypothetical protein